MKRIPKYSRPFIFLNLVFGLFFCFGVYHQATKPDLPYNARFNDPLHHIVSLDGLSLSGEDALEFALGKYQTGDSVPVTSVSSGRESISTITLVPYYSTRHVVIAALVAFIFFALGLFVYIVRPEDIAARLFHFATISVAVSMLGTKSIFGVHPELLGKSLCVLFLMGYSLTPVVFIHFTLVFPRRKWEQFRQRIQWLYAAAILLTLWQSVTILSAVHQRSMEWFALYSLASSVFHGFLFILMAFGVGSFIISYRQALEVSEKKRLRWILFGVALGSLPFIVLWVLPQVFGLSSWISEELFILFLAIIPVAFVISIVRYHILDIDFILNRSVVYAMVLGFALSVYAIIIITCALILQSEFTNSGIISSSVAAIVVALLFQPARIRIEQFVDKRFFHVRYNYRETQKRISDAISSAFDIRQIGECVVQNLRELIPTHWIGFFSIQDTTQKIALVAHSGTDGFSSQDIIQHCEKIKGPAHLPVVLEESVEPGVNVEYCKEEFLRDRGLAMMLTMNSDDGKLLGVVAMSRKKSGFRFTIEDVDLLNAITRQSALAIERLTLQQKLVFEKAESQRLEELNRMKSYFVSSVSHDLKTPLTSIKMFAEIMRSGEKKSDQQWNEYLEIIEGESDRLTRLINNVLDFAAVERGVKKYTFGEVELNSIVRSVIDTLQYQFKMERCSVQTRYADERLDLSADADAMTEAIINLIGNAIKYSFNNREITVTTFRGDESVGVSVSDRGIGIPKENLSDIFEPFYRVPDKKSYSSGGSGLGLSVVKNIVDAHQGRIKVESNPGCGSTFTLIFPVRQTGETNSYR